MTGYGSASAPLAGGTVEAEVRAVNNRFLKVNTRLSEAVAAIEPEVEPIVRRHLRRGTVSVGIAVRSSQSPAAGSIDVAALAEYLRQAAQAAAAARWTGPMGDFLQLPGVVRGGEAAEASADQTILPKVRECLTAALDDLQRMRLREGAAMQEQFSLTLQNFRRELSRIDALADQALGEYETRLEAKIRNVQQQYGLNFNPADILREVTLYADRSDIREELIRFESHIAQMESLLRADESPGRKLEFLIQEMHREANTIGSKSTHGDIAAAVVEIKTGIEQLREIVQNVE